MWHVRVRSGSYDKTSYDSHQLSADIAEGETSSIHHDRLLKRGVAENKHSKPFLLEVMLSEEHRNLVTIFH